MVEQIVVFDVNDTLFRVDSLRRIFDGIDLLFARVLCDGMAVAAGGGFASFEEIARHHLHSMIACDADADRMMGAFQQLDPFEDARPALSSLRERGYELVTLTNGSAATTAALFERATLSACIERHYDATLANAWKPKPEAYLALARELEVEPKRLTLVSAHSWDVLGAKRAGLRTAWVNRRGLPRPSFSVVPDVEARSLIAVADTFEDVPASRRMRPK